MCRDTAIGRIASDAIRRDMGRDQRHAMTEPTRPFFVPMLGIVGLFAALGPAVGGAMFIPLSVVFKPTITPDTIALLVLIAALFGHAVGLIAAYVVGIGPAAATGFLYAFWDAAAPERWPRALVAALI